MKKGEEYIPEYGGEEKKLRRGEKRKKQILMFFIYGEEEERSPVYCEIRNFRLFIGAFY